MAGGGPDMVDQDEALSAASAWPFPIDEGRGPVVVLVHGQPGVASDWRPVVDRLAASSLRVLACDRPGWGVNSLAARGIAANAVWLEEALAATIGDEPAVVVGHSFGGGVAISHAIHHRARVRALVLVASVGSHLALSPMDRVLAYPRVGVRVVNGGLFAARKVGGVFKRRLEASGRSKTTERIEQVALLRTLTGGEPVSERAKASFLVEQRALIDETPALERSLESVAVPTVVLTGTRDLVVPAGAAQALALAIPGAELVRLDGAGHLLPVGEPERLAHTIERYIRLTS